MDFNQKLLDYYGLTAEATKTFFCDVDKLDLTHYGDFKATSKANEIIKQSIAENEKIVIYGDYDCDGIMATSILVKAFSLLSYSVGYYIPSRYLDGYGLNVTRVEEMHEKGYKLIITVDNGIAQFDAINRAKELNMKIIVTDHHQIQDKLPVADVIIHPTLEKYELNCCGAYVALMLANKLLGYQNPYLVTLASIATISDMMVLKDFNRDIVRMGLSYLNENRYLALLSLLDENDAEITEDVVALKIAPKINALGRVLKNTQVNRVVRFLTIENPREINELKNYIVEINNIRREMTKNYCDNLHDFSELEPGIMFISEIDEGLIGLIANRLLNIYHCPVVVFTKDENHDGVIKGSARTLNGFDMSEFLSANRDLFISSGGHSQAAGMTLNIDNYETLRRRFMEYALSHPLVEEEIQTIEISLLDINEENFNILQKFSPFGMGHEAPLFKITNLETSTLKYTKTGAHIYCSLGLKSKIIGYNYPQALFNEISKIHITGYLNSSIFRGLKSVEFKIEKINEASRNFVISPKKIISQCH